MATSSPAAIVCERCGTTLSRSGAKFCPACGAPLRKSGASGWFVVLIVLLILFVTAVAAMFFVRSAAPSAESVNANAFSTNVAADLASLPTALLRGGPPADQMSLNGLTLGAQLQDDRRIEGNEFLVSGGRVSQIAIARPDLLRACRVRDERGIPRQFGDDFSDVQRDGPYVMYDYARRGITVEWDARAGRLNRIILRPPVTP